MQVLKKFSDPMPSMINQWNYLDSVTGFAIVAQLGEENFFFVWLVEKFFNFFYLCLAVFCQK